MTSHYQRAKRIALWQTFGCGLLTLIGIAAWFMASGAADRISNGVPG